MKTIYDFIYCESVITPSTTFFYVAVGVSARDRAAAAYVRRRLPPPMAFFARRSSQSALFIERCALSLFPSLSPSAALTRLRRRFVSVVWLASFLRQCPAALLNTDLAACAAKRVLP